MDSYGYEDEPPMDEEAVIEEFLGENPRARELRLMRNALEQRRAVFLREREKTQKERERANLSAKIEALDKQIAALHEEEAITTFVEDSVRVTLHKPSAEDMEEF